MGILTLNRPDALNALNKIMLQELSQAVTELQERPEVQVILMTGQGKAFVAGADIGEMVNLTPMEAKEFSQQGQEVFQKIALCPKPTMAVINGFALGGGLELALACDLRYGSDKAKFAFPEVGLGIIPGFGGTQMLTPLVGYSKALELILTQEILTAQKALDLGILNKVYPPEELLPSVMAVAQQISSCPPTAIREGKSALRQGMDMSLSQGLALERTAFALTFSAPEQKEAMTAFLQKNKKK